MALFVLHGCGSTTDDIGRLPVTGTVVREDANSAVNGTISFLPLDKGPAATTQIIDGAYEFNRQNGPVSGGYRVIVSSYTVKGQDDAAINSDEETAVIQKSANSEWTFSLIISPESLHLKPLILNVKSSSTE